MAGLIALLALSVAGRVLRWPVRRVGLVLGLAWGVIVLAHALLPPDHALRQMIGGGLAGWVGLGVVTALVLAYRQGLRWIRARAPAPPQPDSPPVADVGVMAEKSCLLLRSDKNIPRGSGGVKPSALPFPPQTEFR